MQHFVCHFFQSTFIVQFYFLAASVLAKENSKDSLDIIVAIYLSELCGCTKHKEIVVLVML